jgi:LysM repeat protein
MFSIAQRFGVSLDALIAANPHIANPKLIFPGDVLCVPQKAPPPPPPPPPQEECCPCPFSLNDFINRWVEVATPCGVSSGRLTFVGDSSIILQDQKTTTVIRCNEICFVRIARMKEEL